MVVPYLFGLAQSRPEDPEALLVQGGDIES